MDKLKGGQRATVHDLARAAGVSLATVDRVLNGRDGVRAATVEKVEHAIKRIDFRRDLWASMLARARDIRAIFFIPSGTNHFMTNLAKAVESAVTGQRASRLQIELRRIAPMDGRALERTLDRLDPDETDCAVIVAIDEPIVRDAIVRAASRGVKVITLVSDLPDSQRHAFVGIDNRAAGRIAASLLGRFCGSGGKVGLVAGSLELRDHLERLNGFREVLTLEFPLLKVVGPVEGRDERERTRRGVGELLRQHPDLVGIYNVGAGNAGLLAALEKAGMAGKLRVVAHELTEPTRNALEDGSVDVVLDQSPEAEVRAVCATVRRLVVGPDAALDDMPIDIKILLRDSLPTVPPR